MLAEDRKKRTSDNSPKLRMSKASGSVANSRIRRTLNMQLLV